MGYDIIFDSDTVDGRNPVPVDMVNILYYLQGFIHPGWCRTSINSMAIL